MTEKSGKVNEIQIDFLKPCPFCQSGNVQAFDIGDTFILYCNDCCATGPEADTREGAIEKWNRRVGE